MLHASLDDDKYLIILSALSRYSNKIIPQLTSLIDNKFVHDIEDGALRLVEQGFIAYVLSNGAFSDQPKTISEGR